VIHKAVKVGINILVHNVSNAFEVFITVSYFNSHFLLPHKSFFIC